MVYQANGAIHLLNKEDLELNSISKFKRQFRKRKNILLSLVYILPRKRMWAISRRSRTEMAKKGTEKVCCKCRDVVLLLCRRGGGGGSDLHEVDGKFSTEMKIKTWLNAAMRRRSLALTDFAGDLVLSRLNLSCKLHFRNHTVSFD